MARVPDERSLVETFEKRPFAIVGVNVDDPADDLARRTREAGISWRSFADGGPRGPITERWEVTAFPTSFLVDHEGVVRGVDLAGEELRREIERLLVEAEAD
jgi:hypothetical protein